MQERRAVIDVGSNSVLLTVAELENGKWTPFLEETAVTSLGEGTKTSGLLSPGGIVRTLDALKGFYDEARSTGAMTVVAGATMAARIARNADEFLKAAELQGTPVIVISGEQEAELGFRSVANDPAFANHDRITIVDVGGQSTELVTAQRVGNGWDILLRRSFPVGTLGLREGVLNSESPDVRAVLQAVCDIDDLIGMQYLPGQTGHVVALGATGTNLVTIREAMVEWDPKKVHASWLDYEEISKAVSWMAAMTDEQRRQIPGMEYGRERTLHIGALILERFLQAVHALGCSVSVRGWRHALLEEQAEVLGG